MQITLTWQTIITASAVVAAIIALVAVFAKGVRWVDRQKQQDCDIKALRATHIADMDGMKQEQTLIVYGLLACLKGLKEQGCNGPVTEAINKIEKHLNQKAHQ
jgi:MFS-type transporter involved in bile tolerance (Atg22 family)